MYILLKKGKLKSIMLKAIEKARSYKTLSKEIKIPRSKIWNYQKYNITLEESRLHRILDYINEKITKEYIEKELPDNWRQTIGGQNCVKKKIKDGTLNQQLTKSRKNIKKTIGDWHLEQKNNNKEKYYVSQHEKFKKAAGYKYLTENKEKVRNKFEKEVADLLKKLNIHYQYEPLIKTDNKSFFPDFLINNSIIIECTMWRGYDKATKLKEKINALQPRYSVYVLIPEKLEKYYNQVKDNLILGLSEFETLAKTFK